MLLFREIAESVGRRLGDMSLHGLNIAREQANRVQREVALAAVWPWLIDEKQFTLVTTYSTGTVAVTNGSRTVTGTSTVWTLEMVGRYFRISGSNITYRIVDVTSNTALLLETLYTDATASAQNYEIFAREYTILRDTMNVLNVRIPEGPRILDPMPRSRIWDFRQSVEGEQIPTQYYDGGRTTAAYYNTGTVTTTSNSKTITGSGTTFDSTMVGKTFRIRGDKRLYTVDTYTSATSIALLTAFQGMAGSALEYEIDPVGMPRLGIYPRTSSAYHVYYTRQRAPRELYEPDDPVDFPDDFADCLIAGGIYFALQIRGSEMGLIDRAKADFDNLVSERKRRSALTDPDMTYQARPWGGEAAASSFPSGWPAVLR